MCCQHVIKELVHAFSSAYIELWMHLEFRKFEEKKLELLSAIASRNSYHSFMLSKLSACIRNSILLSARERAELNKSCNLFGSWSGQNSLIQTAAAGGIRRGDKFS